MSEMVMYRTESERNKSEEIYNESEEISYKMLQTKYQQSQFENKKLRSLLKFKRRGERRIDMAAMVGLMGLTFFCNKCVEVFYNFNKDGILSEELVDICKRAMYVFKSLKWPREHDILLNQKVNLFTTNEEIESFEEMLPSKPRAAEKMLNKLIKDIEFVLQGKSLKKRRRTARSLQHFFDTLGDYSFYAVKDK